MGFYSHVIYLAIKTCLKTCLPRVTLRQINLLRCYIHPNEQPVVFILCFVISLHIDDFTFIAHAQKRQSERL